MKRERTLVKNCAHEGCRETARYRYGSLREMKESWELGKEWRCSRHSAPDEVLSPQNLAQSLVLTATKVDRLDGMFWFRDGAKTGNGFTYGPGFKAWASDFPEGTQIRITAEIITNPQP